MVGVAGGGALVDEAGGHGMEGPDATEIPAPTGGGDVAGEGWPVVSAGIITTEGGHAAACQEAAAGSVAAAFWPAAAYRGTQTADFPAVTGVSKRKSRR